MQARSALDWAAGAIALAIVGCSNQTTPAKQDGVAACPPACPPPAGSGAAATGGASAPIGGNGGQGISAGGANGTTNMSAGKGGGSAGSDSAAGQAAPGGMGGAGGDDEAGGTADAGTMPPDPGGSTLPPTSDYSKPGPFADAKAFPNVGPNNNYTLFRPDASLGKDGFKHAIVAWGNGISTTPDMYTETLTLIASHGFVIIAVNDTTVEEPAMSAGLDWLIAQNDATGPLQGKLDITKEATVGYSWGGGASIDTAHRPNVLCTASLHGMPPRNSDAFTTMHAPLLLFTSTGDSFVTASQYVTPNYDKSVVQTFYATLDDSTAGHLYVADPSAGVCIGAAIGLGDCRGAKDERAPTIAWLRLWVYGDQDARKFFYGDDCQLCGKPWTMPQRKNWL